MGLSGMIDAWNFLSSIIWSVVPAWSTISELVQATVWPIVFIFLAVRFRRPVNDILRATADLIGRIKSFNYKDVAIDVTNTKPEKDDPPLDSNDDNKVLQLLTAWMHDDGFDWSLRQWMAENGLNPSDPIAFLNDPEYIIDVRRAWTDLIERDE